MSNSRRNWPLFLISIAAAGLLGGGLFWQRAQAAHQTQEPAPPTPTIDRLAIPTLPANPNQQDLGREIYYYHCMPCHGDRGQGLTDEFRAVWESDHQDCWASGCHGGRRDDEGFPIPYTVPAVAEAPVALTHFNSPNDLFAYLKQTHPPQYPGKLENDLYWNVSAYLLGLNGRLAVGEDLPSLVLTPTAAPATPTASPTPAATDTQTAPAPTATPAFTEAPPPAGSTDETSLLPYGVAAGLFIFLSIGAWLLRRSPAPPQS